MATLLQLLPVSFEPHKPTALFSAHMTCTVRRRHGLGWYVYSYLVPAIWAVFSRLLLVLFNIIVPRVMGPDA